MGYPMRVVLLVSILFVLVACRPAGLEPAAVLPTPTPTVEIVCIRDVFEIMIDSDADVLAETEAASWAG
jgi:hypothetical protein